MTSTIKLKKRDNVQPKSKHNVPLMESILLSFTIFLSCGLFLMMAVNYIRDHYPIFPVRTSLDNGSWEHVHNHGEIKVTQKKTSHVLPYKTFRYQYKIDLPFDSLVDILSNPVQSKAWFAWIVVDSDEDPEGNIPEDRSKTLETCTVQMKVPYLQRHNREFHLCMSSEIATMAQDYGDGQIRQATFQFQPDEEEALGALICKECKRGELNMNLTLTADEGDDQETDIEMKLYMNFHSKRIPTFLLNNISRQWGTISLLKLIKMCRDSLGLNDTVGSKMTLYHIFPIKR